MEQVFFDSLVFIELSSEQYQGKINLVYLKLSGARCKTVSGDKIKLILLVRRINEFCSFVPEFDSVFVQYL